GPGCQFRDSDHFLASTHHTRSEATTDSPAGKQWGTLIHGLMEYAINDLECSSKDLAGVAQWLCATNGLAGDMIPAALETVERVRGSAFWNRVRTAGERLTEVPIASLIPGQAGRPTVAKGVIDLALRVPGGWEIFDFKSDLASMEEITVT